MGGIDALLVVAQAYAPNAEVQVTSLVVHVTDLVFAQGVMVVVQLLVVRVVVQETAIYAMEVVNLHASDVMAMINVAVVQERERLHVIGVKVQDFIRRSNNMCLKCTTTNPITMVILSWQIIVTRPQVKLFIPVSSSNGVMPTPWILTGLQKLQP